MDGYWSSSYCEIAIEFKKTILLQFEGFFFNWLISLFHIWILKKIFYFLEVTPCTQTQNNVRYLAEPKKG